MSERLCAYICDHAHKVLRNQGVITAYLEYWQAQHSPNDRSGRTRQHPDVFRHFLLLQ